MPTPPAPATHFLRLDLLYGPALERRHPARFGEPVFGPPEAISKEGP
jgi:hypothetical protein